MKKISKLVLLIACLPAAAAYVDPSSGVALGGSVWPLIAAFGAALLAIILKPVTFIKRVLGTLFKKK